MWTFLRLILAGGEQTAAETTTEEKPEPAEGEAAEKEEVGHDYNVFF